MRKIPLFVLGLVLVSVLKLNTVLAQTATPTLVPTPVPTSVVATTTSTPTPTQVVLPVPQGISAVMISDDRIDVSWKSSTGASAYEVYRNDELVAIVSSLFYSDNGLDAETSYSYKVRAYDGTNYSQYSTNVSATTRSASAQGTPEPTIPLGPDDNKLMPSVQELHSYVTVGSVKHEYNEMTAFNSGEEFIILGRTEEYADIEIVVKSDPTSYFAKADDDGFWEVSVNTEILEEGEHSFKIIITTPDFPEKYESEEYMFEINPKIESTAVPAVESSFGSRLNRIVLIALVLVVVLFIILIIVALKKGWFNKLKSGTGEVDSSKQGENMELNNLIQIDQVKEPTAQNPNVPQDVLSDVSVPTSRVPLVNSGVTDEMITPPSELTSDLDASSAIPTTPSVKSPTEEVETSEDVIAQDNPIELEASLLPEENATQRSDNGSVEEDPADASVTEMTIDTDDESNVDLNIEEIVPNPSEDQIVASDSENVVVNPDEELLEPIVEENATALSDQDEEIVLEPTQDVPSPDLQGGVSGFTSPKSEGLEVSSDPSTLKTEIVENDYSSTTPIQEGSSPDITQTNDDEMVTRDGIYTSSLESAPTVITEEPSPSESQQDTEEKPNDISGL